ncbi:MAG: dienelactone hydrolase family protein [Verrucomicrobiota bacterium]
MLRFTWSVLLVATGMVFENLPAFGEALPRELLPYFQPPAEFAGKLGDYRSPLKFYDGKEVKTAADWPKRRAELLAKWQEVMGPWPEVLANPKLEILSTTNREDFIQHKVKVQYGATQFHDGYLLVPQGKGKFPAVLVPFYEPETSVGLAGKPLRDFARQLTKRGFVTLSIGSPGGSAYEPDVAGAKCQPLSYHAYVSANCANALANLPQVDAKRIGVMGHSYGGKWAMFSACLNEKFVCAVWSDPGIAFDETRTSVNYWEPWYLGKEAGVTRKRGLPTKENPRTGAYKVMVEQGMDLPEFQALMAPRPFFVSGGSEDFPARWVALNHPISVYKLLGLENRVGMSNRPKHDPTEESNELIYRFFEHFLKGQ